MPRRERETRDNRDREPRRSERREEKKDRKAPAQSYQMYVDGSTISVSVWINLYESRDGEKFEKPTIKVQKRYKDNKGEWQESNYFSQAELAVLAVLIQQAQAFLLQRKASLDADRRECYDD